MTRTKMTIAAVLVSMLAFGLTFGGVAQARRGGPHGTTLLSLAANDAGSKVKAQGAYLPPASSQCPRGGRYVILEGGATGAGTTSPSGGYNFQSGPVASGSYAVRTHVPGIWGGPYGNTQICWDAYSLYRSVTVK